MTFAEGIQAIVQLAFLALAGLTLVDYIRRRNPTRLEIALLFGCLAPTLVLGELERFVPEPAPWVSRLGTLGVVAQPYILLRLVHRLRGVPAWIRTAALSGMLLSWAVLLVLPEDPAPALTLIVIVYFAAVEIYAAMALLREGRARGGVARRRMLLAAAGSGWLAAVIVLAGVAIALPGIGATIAPLSQALPLLSAGSYYLGFTPPRFLRRSWQLGELYSFIRLVSGLPPGLRLLRVLDLLCPAATAAVGGVGSGVWTGAGSDPLALRASDRPGLDGADQGLLERLEGVRRSRSPAVWWMAPEAASDGAKWAEAVALADTETTWGVLVVFLRNESLFPEDDLELLGLLAEETAMALSSADVLARERELAGRLERVNANLKAEAEERRRADDETRVLNRQLEERTAELEAANQELEAFSYSVSHDLRAPLRSIDGFTQALAEDYADRLDEQARDYTQRVRKAAQRMGILIDDLLRLSRVTRAEMHRRSVDLSAVALEVAGALRVTEPNREISIEVEAGLAGLGDPQLLRVALENLLGNAWKFTSRVAAPRIEFGATQQNGATTYFIRDNGAGFDSQYAGKLFSAFQRLHSSAEYPGTGIGLATVQRVILRHGGRVWAEGEVGKGATFYFTLP